MDPTTADRTLGVLLKEREDLDRIRSQGIDTIMARAQQQSAPGGLQGGYR
jgi:hypothetical protein